MAKNVIAVSVLLDNKQFKRGIADTQSATQALDNGFKTIGKTLAGAFAGTAVGAIAVVGAALAKYTPQAVAASDATDKFKKTMEFGGIKTDEIERVTKSTQNYADVTVYGIADIQNATAQLAANGVKDYDKLVEAAGNLNAVAGGNAETFKSVTMVMTQTAGAGKLTTENWNQMANAIPGASGALQEAMKKNGAYTGNFREAMEKGQITAEEFNQAMMDLGFTDVAVEAAKSTDTFEGAFGNLEATVVGGLTEIVKELKPFITEWTNGFAEKVGPALKDFKNVLVDQVIPGATDFFNNLKGIGEWVNNNKEWLQPLLIGMGTFVGLLAALQGGLTLGIGAIKAFKAITDIAKVAQLLFNASLLANPFVVVAALLAGLVAGLVWFFTQTETGKKAWKSFTDTVSKLWDDFSKFMGNVWKDIVKFFDGGVKGAKDIVGTLSKWVGDRFTDIKNAGDAVGRFFTNDVPAFFGRAKDAVAERFAAVKDGILRPIKSALDWINANFIKKINGFLGSINISWRLPELSVPGYANGGYTGPGHRLKPAGIVHAGEIVWSQNDIRRFGGINAVEAARLSGSVPGYETGGVVAGGNSLRVFQASVKRVAQLLAKVFGVPVPWTGAAGRPQAAGYGYVSDHPRGMAFDVMFNKLHDPKGYVINDWLHKNAEALALKYTVWDGYSYPLRLGGKRGKALNRGDATNNHYDHVHASFKDEVASLKGVAGGGFGIFSDIIKSIPLPDPMGSVVKAVLGKAVEGIQLFDSGGWLKPGHVGFNASKEPEAVFTKNQLKRHMGNTYIFNGIEVKSSRVEELLDELAQEVTRYSGVGV